MPWTLQLGRHKKQQLWVQCQKLLPLCIIKVYLNRTFMVKKNILKWTTNICRPIHNISDTLNVDIINAHTCMYSVYTY